MDGPLVTGTLERTSLEEVIGVVSLSRQYLEVRFGDGQRATGALMIKGGHLIDARTDLGERGLAAFRSLIRHPGTRFSVFRSPGFKAKTSIGPLIPLLDDARRGSRRKLRLRTAQDLVLEGSFDEFSLPEVIRVLSFSRQKLRVIFLSGTREASMLIKGGQLLEARGPGALRDLQTIRSIQEDAWDTFRAYRVPDDSALTSIVGPLRELMSEPTVPAAAKRSVVVEGRFDQFSATDVIAVLSTSRQPMTLELWHAEQRQGSITVKAGQILSAQSSNGRRGMAIARKLIERADRFVLLRERLTHEVSPIGTLAQLTQSPPASAPLLEGTFTSFPPEDVLGTLALSRQCLELQLARPGHPGATIVIKSGQLLVWPGGQEQPDAVVASVLRRDWSSFRILRREVPQGARPLVALADLQRHRGSLRPPDPAPQPATRTTPAAQAGSVARLDAALEELRQVQSRRQLTAQLDGVLHKLDALERRLEDQDRAFVARRSPGAGQSHALFLATFQLGLLFVLVLSSLSGWLWGN